MLMLMMQLLLAALSAGKAALLMVKVPSVSMSITASKQQLCQVMAGV